jgi:hypothetical protein
VDAGRSVTFSQPLVANIDYLFLAAGDQDAQIVEMEVYDNVTNLRVAQDKTNNREAVVAYRPQYTANYILKVTLKSSNNNLPCICSLVMLRRNGWTIPFKNLNDVTRALSNRVADLNKMQPGNKQFAFTRVPNQWAVFGGALKPNTDLGVNNVTLGFGQRAVVGSCDKLANKLDLYLTLKGNAVASYQGPATNEPCILQNNCQGGGYGLRLRNSSALLGSSLVMMAVLDTK